MSPTVTLLGINIGIWVHNLVTMLAGTIPHA